MIPTTRPIPAPPLLLLFVLATACGQATPDAPADAASDRRDPADGPRLRVVETAPLHIDRLYPSMAGPDDRLTLDPSELDWVVAYDTEVRDAIDDEPMGDEFFCHSQIQMDDSTRLLVTATGSEEIRFPDGFAMPVSRILAGYGAERHELTFLGMVLNNHRPEIDRLARVRATIEYWRDDDFGDAARPRALYKVGLPMAVEDLEAYSAPDGSPPANEDDVARHCVLVGGLNSHWLVPPGTQITRRRFEAIVPVESTVHYGVVHLHNYGDYLRLTDVTTGEVLFQTDVAYEPDRVQIERIPVYDSAEGFRIYPDHVYEIEASYTNTTDADVDAMAQIDLYYHPSDGRQIVYEAPDV